MGVQVIVFVVLEVLDSMFKCFAATNTILEGIKTHIKLNANASLYLPRRVADHFGCEIVESCVTEQSDVQFSRPYTTDGLLLTAKFVVWAPKLPCIALWLAGYLLQ
jgi:hypothetical protein